MLFIYLLVAVTAFLGGYLTALKIKPEISSVRKKGDFAATEKLRREYENFLNYDGSEQQ